MTGETAIALLNNLRAFAEEDDEPAIDMAIEAIQFIEHFDLLKDGDLISREEVLRMIIVAGECGPDLGYTHLHTVIKSLPSAEPEIKPIEYRDCANAMLKMWMDNVVTDGEYNRIMDKLNEHWVMENE